MSNAVVDKNWWQANAKAAMQPWLRELQKQSHETFLARGLPTRKDERWKYTDVSFLQKETYTQALPAKITADAFKSRRLDTENIFIVLINGQYSVELSDTTLLHPGVTVCSVSQALNTHADIIKTSLQRSLTAQHSVFSDLNMAMLTDGVFLLIPKNIKMAVPVHILFLSAEQNNYASSPGNFILAEENTSVTLLEEHAAINSENYFTNIATDIHAGNNAQIYYHKIQHDAPSATHIANFNITQQRDSTVKCCTLTLGSRLSRDEVNVNLSASGAYSSINGFYLLKNDGQHIDNHIQIDHAAPHGTSDMMYKGILDKKSHAVFNGKIYVHKNAQKTRSGQANHNLLLSPHASVDTKPELEIYNDDVKCAHGDTVGQLDKEALFYLRSRGIEHEGALKLLAYAYAADVMNRVTHQSILRRMHHLLTIGLAGESA